MAESSAQAGIPTSLSSVRCVSMFMHTPSPTDDKVAADNSMTSRSLPCSLTGVL
jgi:hypothetical protein